MVLSEIVAVDCICLPSGTVLRGDEAAAFVAEHGNERVLWSENFKAFIDFNGSFHVKVAAQKPEDIEFVGFNEVRAERGAKAAKFEHDCSWLWMDQRDITLNIATIGDHPELLKGLEAYRAWTEGQTSSTTRHEPTSSLHLSQALA